MVKKVLKLSASWCMPCHAYAKIFNTVKEEDKYKNIIFEEIDIEENEDLASKYLVKSVPTTVILDENGNVLSKFSGIATKAILEEEINKANG